MIHTDEWFFELYGSEMTVYLYDRINSCLLFVLHLFFTENWHAGMQMEC